VVSGLSRPQPQNQRTALRTARVQVSFLAGRVSLFTGVRFPSGMGLRFLAAAAWLGVAADVLGGQAGLIPLESADPSTS
jgi:hypothetical protein